MQSSETANTDVQHVLSAIDQLLSLNGWVGALCPTLVRPFSAPSSWEDSGLASIEHAYYIALVVHSADHFLLDQLATIVQLSRRLRPASLFVSVLDYASSDATSTLTDLTEAVLTLLSIPFRIRRVARLTADPKAAYYPLEEAYMRNLVLEPLWELTDRRGVRFRRVVWLKGFTCPNDVLETVRVSVENGAAVVCGTDWAESKGEFYFNGRWRTRDISGDQFRQASSKAKEASLVPPRDAQGAARYVANLPFQVFCCEAGTHVVDPEQSYYKGIRYRAGTGFQNISALTEAELELLPERGEDAECLDSSQMWFCRDLWIRSARDGVTSKKIKEETEEMVKEDGARKEVEEVKPEEKEEVMIPEEQRPDVEAPIALDGQVAAVDADANAGSDYDAMPEEEVPLQLETAAEKEDTTQNLVFLPARIMVNPRCVTTYAGVSHTRLALELFGHTDADGVDADGDVGRGGKRYMLEEWQGAPKSFVCQEQR